MNPRKLIAVVFSIILAGTVFLPAAAADEWNQATKMNFSEPVEIPGRVLPAGTYWFVLADSQGDQQIVQIFNADRTKIYATEEAVPTERPHQLPEALLKWYYPGRLSGQEFLYSQKAEKDLMRDARQNVLASPINSSAMLPTAGG